MKTLRETTVEMIYSAVRSLPEDDLLQVLRFVQDLGHQEPAALPPLDDVAPLYKIHSAAVRTGVVDLAHQHDHYLYGLDKHDA